MGLDTTNRTLAPEIMDDFLLEGEELREALDKIAVINTILGGNRLTLQGVKKLLDVTDVGMPITIADIGCGNGDMLRMLAEYGKKNNLQFNLIGIDANLYTIEYAKKLSPGFGNISFECINIFADEFKKTEYDIVLCTLTLHHFSDAEILQIMAIFNEKAKTGIVINDLHRSKTAYRLFQAIGMVFRLNRMSREDGLTSILRGFRKRELESFSQKLNLKKYSIRWKWAYRYQWIIYKV